MTSSRQFSFLNGPKKLVFVRMYESTGLVGPPYPYCSLVAFYTFAWFVLLVFFCAFGVCKIFLLKKLKSLKLH